jgi:hypothetical protein
MTPEHLKYKTSDRGFTHLPPIPSEYGGHVLAYESSSAEGPHLWLRTVCPVDLNEPEGLVTETVAHLTLENAQKLQEQLAFLIKNHYQLR